MIMTMKYTEGIMVILITMVVTIMVVAVLSRNRFKSDYD